MTSFPAVFASAPSRLPVTSLLIPSLVLFLSMSLINPAAAALESPQILSPEAEGFDDKPVFVWRAVTGADKYRLRIAQSGQVLFNQRITASAAGCVEGGDCTYRPAIALAFNKRMNWKVRAFDGPTRSSWSEVKRYTLETSNAPVIPTTPEGVHYRVSWDSAENLYRVFLRPTITPIYDLTLTGQVTLRVPHTAYEVDAFEAIDVVGAHTPGMRWGRTSLARSPSENPDYDYLSFTISGFDYRALGLQGGLEAEIFNFRNSGSCAVGAGGVIVMGNEDRFANWPNSFGTNPANQFTNLGLSPPSLYSAFDKNHFLGAYGPAADCSDSAVLNTLPVALGDNSVETDVDTAVAVTLNGTDADGDVLDYVVGQPENGVLSGISPNLAYTPNVGFSGTDSFTFRVSDGVGSSKEATVRVTVNQVTIAPPVTPELAGRGVGFRVAWDSDASSYRVFMKSTVTPVPDLTLTGQVTLRVPRAANAFNALAIQNGHSGVQWRQSSTVRSPSENPAYDYLSFTVSLSNFTALNLQGGLEAEIFSFRNSGSCVTGDVTVMDNADVFANGPNSIGTNPANQFTNLGFSSSFDENHFLGVYGAAANCSE